MQHDLLLKLYVWEAGLAGGGLCPGASARNRWPAHSIEMHVLSQVEGPALQFCCPFFIAFQASAHPFLTITGFRCIISRLLR